jgi:hypothetical protein
MQHARILESFFPDLRDQRRIDLFLLGGGGTTATADSESGSGEPQQAAT